LENNHHIVTMGMRDNGEIDMLNLKEIPRSKGIEHIEEDINYVIQDLNIYNPDIIIVDKGFNGNYNDILMKYYGEGRVYSCVVRSAKSNGDPIAHFNTSDSTVTIDKLTQNIIALSNMKRGSIKFWRGADHDQDIALFCRHWSNVIFRTDETEDSDTHEIGTQQVISRKGADHYAQSMVYANLGLNKLMKEYSTTRNHNTEVSVINAEDIIRPEKTIFQDEYGL